MNQRLQRFFVFLQSTIAVGLLVANATTYCIGADSAGKSIFNGKDFSNWHGRPTVDPRKWSTTPDADKAKWAQEIKDHWRIENDEIVNDGQGAYLTTNDEYGDFEFAFEYKIVAGCDSGIYLRGNPQVQIWDPDAENNKANGNEKGSGGLWNNPKDWAGKDPESRADKPIGQWNTMKIRLLGERCTVWLNDARVVNHQRMANYFAPGEPLFPRGPIQLQTHGAEIRFRNLTVKEFSADEANALLREAESQAIGQKHFQSLFNGKDLSGWKGAIDSYSVVDGSIQCKSGKGGTLYSERDFSDYVFRVDFQLPPAGNNGLVMRYPSQEDLEKMPKDQRHGDGAYVAMCELQVLDDGHANYASIDARQAHGSAYGMVAAKRGFLRPVGQWNHEIVTVKGSKIQVELNGTRILDADLSTVTEYMANSPHPGKERTHGHVGFAGHSDPVPFRNVEILPLGE